MYDYDHKLIMIMVLYIHVATHGHSASKYKKKYTIYENNPGKLLPGTIIRGTLKSPNSQLVTPISIKLQRLDGCD
jgi:hypothetical protein